MLDPLAHYFSQSERSTWLSHMQDTQNSAENVMIKGQITTIANQNLRELAGFVRQMQFFANETLQQLANALRDEPLPLLNAADRPPSSPLLYTKSWNTLAPSKEMIWENAPYNASFFSKIHVLQDQNKGLKIHLTVNPAFIAEFRHELLLLGVHQPQFSEDAFVFQAETLLEIDIALYLIAQYVRLPKESIALLKNLATTHKTLTVLALQNPTVAIKAPPQPAKKTPTGFWKRLKKHSPLASLKG